MFWGALTIIFVALLVLLAFVLGVSFGASYTAAEFQEVLVPVFGAMGGWVSGLGALAAVLTTLWLADRQRREDVESLKVSMVCGLLNQPNCPWFLSVEVTVDGKRPVKITSIVFTSKHSKLHVHVTGFMRFGDQTPISLVYADQAKFNLDFGFESQLQKYVDEHCSGRSDGLKVRVNTSLRYFEADVPAHMLTLNKA